MSSSLVHTSSPIFNTTRNSSTEFIQKVKDGAGPLLNLSPLPTQQQQLKQQLFSIIYKVQNFSNLLKDILTDAFNTVRFPSVLTTEDEQIKITVLEVLKSIVGSIRRFTDESLESIGREASEALVELSRQLQELENELDEAKVSARFYSAIFSALVMAFAALVAPVATLAVAPFLQRIDLVWEDIMGKPIMDELKVFQAVIFKIHSAIAVAGKIQDSVYGLSARVTDDPLCFSAVSGDIKLMEEVKEGALLLRMRNCPEFGHVIEFQEGVGKFLEVGDVSKRLMEMEKMVADTMAQVAMAEHELEQLVQTLMPLKDE